MGVVISVFAMSEDSVTHANIFPWGYIILEQLSECIRLKWFRQQGNYW